MAKKRIELDINTAFKFPFRDPNWVNKFGIAALLSLTIIGFLPVMGWAIEMQRVLVKTGKSKLPEWDRIGEYFGVGFKYFVMGIMIQIPYYLVLCAYTLFFVQNPDSVHMDEIFGVSWVLFQILQYLWLFVAFIATGVFSGVYAETHSVLDALNIPRALKLFRANWKQYLGAAFLGYAANTAAGFAGLILLCIGILFTAPIGLVIMHQLYGQAYRNAKTLAGKIST